MAALPDVRSGVCPSHHVGRLAEQMFVAEDLLARSEHVEELRQEVDRWGAILALILRPLAAPPIHACGGGLRRGYNAPSHFSPGYA